MTETRQQGNTQEALLRLMRSIDIKHLKFDFMDAAQNARNILEKNGTPVRDNDKALIKRANLMELYPWWEAGKHGDDHPIGTFTVDLDLEVALFLERNFSMKTEFAPEGFDINAIQGAERGEGMSVADHPENTDAFLTLTCRDREDRSNQYTFRVGPDRLRDAVEALEYYHAEKVLGRVFKRLGEWLTQKHAITKEQDAEFLAMWDSANMVWQKWGGLFQTLKKKE